MGWPMPGSPGFMGVPGLEPILRTGPFQSFIRAGPGLVSFPHLKMVFASML